MKKTKGASATVASVNKALAIADEFGRKVEKVEKGGLKMAVKVSGPDLAKSAKWAKTGDGAEYHLQITGGPCGVAAYFQRPGASESEKQQWAAYVSVRDARKALVAAVAKQSDEKAAAALGRLLTTEPYNELKALVTLLQSIGGGITFLTEEKRPLVYVECVNYPLPDWAKGVRYRMRSARLKAARAAAKVDAVTRVVRELMA